jgi:hypothetical protein
MPVALGLVVKRIRHRPVGMGGVGLQAFIMVMGIIITVHKNPPGQISFWFYVLFEARS